MLPEITVRRPQGLVPRLTVRRRTVVDYQPSWLLLAVPVLAVAAARRKGSTSQSRSAPASSGQTSPGQTAPGTGAPGTPAPERRRPRRGVVVRLTRLRRRPGLPPVVEQADVVVPVQTDSTT